MSVLAHAGGTGWDEVLLTIAPMLVSLLAVGVLRRRISALHPTVAEGG